MFRTFIAIEIDGINKKILSDVISSLKKSDTNIKWITQDQMHLTLKFLGNVEENTIKNISDAIKSIATNYKKFNLSFSKIGAFPNTKQPRVIWIGIEKGKNELKILNEKIEAECEKLGFEKEKREYRPHLTLGRVKSLKNITNLTNIIDETNFDPQGNVKINKLTLFKSTLTPKGAIYDVLYECDFS